MGGAACGPPERPSAADPDYSALSPPLGGRASLRLFADVLLPSQRSAPLLIRVRHKQDGLSDSFWVKQKDETHKLHPFVAAKRRNVFYIPEDRQSRRSDKSLKPGQSAGGSFLLTASLGTGGVFSNDEISSSGVNLFKSFHIKSLINSRHLVFLTLIK